MAEFTFVHCADLHLDSPFVGLARMADWLAQRLRNATFEAFERVVQVALEHEAAALLIAGDVFNAAQRSLLAQRQLQRLLERAVSGGVRCFVVAGNHDPLPSWRQEGLRLPPDVHLFGPQPECVPLERDGQLLAYVCGVSFPREEVRENLARRLPAPPPGCPFAIALLHCNVGGAAGHANYAPCALAQLQEGPFDYWALGHLHDPQVLAEDPWVVYGGTTQGRTLAERGERGCWLVRVEEGRLVEPPRFVPTAPVRWEEAEASIEGARGEQELFDLLCEHKERCRRAGGVLLRLRLRGRGPLDRRLRDPAARRDLLETLNDEEEREDFVWTVALEVHTGPPLDLDALRGRQDFVGDFLRLADALGAEPARLREVLVGACPHPGLKQALGGWDEGRLRRLLEAARARGLWELLGDVD